MCDENDYFTQARISKSTSGNQIAVFFLGSHTKALLHLPLGVLSVSMSCVSPCVPTLS